MITSASWPPSKAQIDVPPGHIGFGALASANGFTHWVIQDPHGLITKPGALDDFREHAAAGDLVTLVTPSETYQLRFDPVPDGMTLSALGSGGPLGVAMFHCPTKSTFMLEAE